MEVFPRPIRPRNTTTTKLLFLSVLNVYIQLTHVGILQITAFKSCLGAFFGVLTMWFPLWIYSSTYVGTLKNNTLQSCFGAFWWRTTTMCLPLIIYSSKSGQPIFFFSDRSHFYCYSGPPVSVLLQGHLRLRRERHLKQFATRSQLAQKQPIPK